MPQQHKLCFVIADGGHARFVRPAEDNALHTFDHLDSDSVHKRTRDLVSDRMGRSFESASPTRHAVVARTDPHDQEKLHFAAAISEWIKVNAAEDVFNEIVLVAPSHILTELEAHLDTETRAILHGVLAKDLVKVPDGELWPHLHAWVRPVHRAT